MCIRENLESRGFQLPPIKPKGSHFDSNCITPGTEFMARLAVCLQYYIHDRMNTNPVWQNISVSFLLDDLSKAYLYMIIQA